MAEIKVDRRALDTLFTSTSGEVAKDLQRRALKVEGAAKRLCPVDTGRLRSSITNAIGHDEQGLVAVIGTNVEYAAFVELGTSKMPAQPYLRPALEAGR